MRFFFCRFLLESAVGLFLICGVVLRLSIWIFYISKIQMGGIYGEICTKKGIYQRKWRLCGIILHGVLPLQGIRPDLYGQALLAVGPEAAVKKIEDAVASNMQDWGKRYPHAGYGGSFRHWLKENNPKPYGSYGNGSAMRVSAVGWLYDSMERTREVARATANVTHNHPEGIKGAESTASAIYMARNGSSKEEIKTYIEREFHYDLSRTLDNIRTYYHHVESCQETVPEAIIAFLESKDFEDAIRNAVSLGGDTDTLGAITGSIAEAFYGIPAVLIAECKSRIDKGLMTDVLDEFDHVLGRSVDTYSDEVDETQANQMIEAAIDQYYIQQDKNGMLLFMEVMVTRMQQAGEVIVPYITENPFMSEEQISKVKAGDTISLDHDVRLKIETVKDSDEKEWIGVFTSSEEMHKGSAGNVQMNQSIESILRLALNWEQVNASLRFLWRVLFPRCLSIDELSQVYTFLTACAVYPRGRKSA